MFASRAKQTLSVDLLASPFSYPQFAVRLHPSIQSHDTEDINVLKKRSVLHSHRDVSCLVVSRSAESDVQRGGPGRRS